MGILQSNKSIGSVKAQFVFTLLVLITRSQLLNQTEVRVWTEPGQYYGHFCQLSIEIISANLRQPLQTIFITAQQNMLFWDQQLQNPGLVATQSYQEDAKQYKEDNNYQVCKIFQASNRYCMYLQNRVLPFKKLLRRNINQTHFAFQFRITRAVCPLSHLLNKIKLRIQIPVDYGFDQYSPSLQRRFSQTIEAKLVNLTYRYFKSQNFQFIKQAKYFLASQNRFKSLSNYSFQLKLPNIQLATSWSRTQIKFKDSAKTLFLQQKFQIKSTHNISVSCEISSFNQKVTLINHNFTPFQRQFEYNSFEYYKDQKQFSLIDFSMELFFISEGQTQIEIIVYGNHNESAIKSFNKYRSGILGLEDQTVILGIGHDRIYSVSEETFYSLQETKKKYPKNYGQQQNSSQTSAEQGSDSYDYENMQRLIQKQRNQTILVCLGIFLVLIFCCSHRNPQEIKSQLGNLKFVVLKYAYSIILFTNPILTLVVYLILQDQHNKFDTPLTHQNLVIATSFIIASLVIHGFFSLISIIILCSSKSFVKKYFKQKKSNNSEKVENYRSVCWAILKILFDNRFLSIMLNQIVAQYYQQKCSQLESKKHKQCILLNHKHQIDDQICIKGIIKSPWIYNLTFIAMLLSAISKYIQICFEIEELFNQENLLAQIQILFNTIQLLFTIWLCKKVYLFGRVSSMKKIVSEQLKKAFSSRIKAYVQSKKQIEQEFDNLESKRDDSNEEASERGGDVDFQIVSQKECN